MYIHTVQQRALHYNIRYNNIVLASLNNTKERGTINLHKRITNTPRLDTKKLFFFFKKTFIFLSLSIVLV